MQSTRRLARESFNVAQLLKGDLPIKTMNMSELVPCILGSDSRQLVLLSGIPAGGKSTFGLQLKPFGYEYHNADLIRKELYGDESIFGNTKDVFGLLNKRLRETLARGGKAVVDVTNVTLRSRQEYRDMAAEFGYPACPILMMDVPLSTSLKRNQLRERHVPEYLIMSMVASMVRGGMPTSAEGNVHFIRPGAAPGEYSAWTPAQAAAEDLSPGIHAVDLPLSRLPFKAVIPDKAQKTDIIGDVHGCFDELLALLEALGHKLKFKMNKRSLIKVTEFQPKQDRMLAFAGDFVDRGPASDKVLALVRWLYRKGHAFAVAGNHDDRLRRFLKGDSMRAGWGLRQTAEQVRKRSRTYQRKTGSFLNDLPLVAGNEHLVLVHAAYREQLHGDALRQLALFGETSPDVLDEHGRRVRQTLWEDEYSGNRTIVRGHDVVLNPTLKLTRNGGWIANVDTGCCYGNKLTAFRFPEMYFVSVPAQKVHVKPDFELK